MERNVIICSDGTNNQFSKTNTNVVQLYQLLKLPARGPDARIPKQGEQIGFYDPGVGTFDPAGRDRNSEFSKLYGMATGRGIRQNICEAYRYLMDWYEPGDRIYLFGFSRGAYTVRALAGMLSSVGLLSQGNISQIDYAYDMYKYNDDKSIQAAFKKTFSQSCEIEMLGVWDTVATVIQAKPQLKNWFLPTKEAFSNTKLSTIVKHAYQACALDENRTQFKLSLWNEKDREEGQTIEQVWFAGVHSDVGGWWEDTRLTSIALKWMIEKAIGHGLTFRDDWNADLLCDPLGPQHDSRSNLWAFTDIKNGFKPDERFPPAPPHADYAVDGKYRVHTSVKQRCEGGPVPHLDTVGQETRKSYRPELLTRSDIVWV